MIQADPKNSDDVFDRSLIVGLLSFLHDTIQVPETRNGETTLKVVPCFYSRTGETQFVIDYFLDTDKYATKDCLRVAEGITNRIPSGVISIQAARILEDSLTSGGARAVYSRKVETDFGDEIRQFSARTDFIPQEYDFNLEFRCTSDLERMKIRQVLVQRFYRARRFFIQHAGFQGIPVLVGFPSEFDLSKDFQYQFPDGGDYPKLALSLEVRTLMPNPDPATERGVSGKIQDFEQRVSLAPRAAVQDNPSV